jgi:hypothetical protein
VGKTSVLAGAVDTTPSGLYQGRQLYKMLPPKLNFEPVADAFARVINVAAYQGQWITAKDYAHSINYEHDGYVRYNNIIIQLVKNGFITRIFLCCFRASNSSKKVPSTRGYTTG